jgi:signal transduction histidine kinase
MEQTAVRKKILIIDDEESYRQIIAMTLQVSNFDVIEAADGAEGMAAAKMHHPDLILCDVNMPKMDGHALLGMLKAEREFAGIPFIFLTGNSGHGDMRKGMQLGADDYLTKPFTAEELVNAVNARFTKKQNIQRFFESQFDDIRSNIVLSLPHEYRTPLNGILGFSQILIDEANISEEEVKQIGTMIHRSGKRLHHLLENMVLFGQLQLWQHDEQKKSEMRLHHPAGVCEAVPGVLEEQMRNHERPGAVTSSLADCSVKMSVQYLMKIVEELTDNALKFSGKGSRVTVNAELRGSSVVISVSDTGRGMTEEQIGRIAGFQQFERGYYEQQGAGLGLMVTRLLAEIHGGEMTIESEKGSGTTVHITLPAAE